MKNNPVNRRNFLRTLGTGSAAALVMKTGSLLSGYETAAGPAPDNAIETMQNTVRNGPDIGTFYPTITELSRENSYPCSFLEGNFQTLGDFKSAGREKVLEAYGYRPRPVSPNPEIIEQKEFNEYIREKVIFSTSEYFRVPAYVHIPKGLTERAPAIVDLHSHGGMFLYGKEKVIDMKPNDQRMIEYHKVNYEGRPTTTELVQRGYIVITIDAFMFGERRVMMEEDLSYGWDRSAYSPEDINYLNGQCRSKANTLVKSLIYTGMTWPGIVSWDDMRTVDYLITRPEVDPDRIGCIGVSFGGWRSLFLAGLDERISAACVSGFMSTVKPMLRNHIDTHSWVHFVPGLHRYLDIPDVVSMMAPKPLMVQQCRQDGLFPLEGMKESVEKIASVYKKAGVGEQFDGRFYDINHILNVEMQNEAFDWFDQHLK
jgi:dienelactone hydrolase